VIAALAALADPEATLAVTAERAFGRKLSADCHAPLAAYATRHDGRLWLRGLIASRDGREVLRGERESQVTTLAEATALGETLGAEFLARGAARVLAA